jgi:hypothetical protein
MQNKNKQMFIVIKHENVNTKGTKQGYGIKSYSKLMLKKLNIMRNFIFICTFMGT